MFNPLACVSPRLQRRGEEFEEFEEASPCSTTSSTPRSCSTTPTPTTKTKTTTTTTSGGKKGLNKKKKNNPYSTSGLDKFSTLLADLEERKRKIYAQVDDANAPYVGFIRSKSGDWLPIVVRLGNHDHHTSTTTPIHQHNKLTHDHKAVALTKKKPVIGVCGTDGKDKSLQGQGSTQYNPPPPPPPPDGNYNPPSSSRCSTTTTTTTTSTPIKNNRCSSKASSPQKLVQLQQQQQEHRKQATLATATASAYSSSCMDDDGRTAAASNNNNKKKKSGENSMGMMMRWGRPSEYLPLVVVLSLVCLLMFGRSVAILLTSACWYLIPTIKTTPPTSTTTTTPMNPNPKRPSPSSSFVKKKNKEYATRLGSHEKNNNIIPSSNMPNIVDSLSKRRRNGRSW
ncbi:uncharacterized protein LOC122065159 [Macadamia integrifolia]|uniref:uncharacterized protein LOC122065159 n=1 Tax=Macadamia integrifolia TaxID=60698 RepID=UPI001C4ED7C1|nr:uncharacterized protein LOC122065159 [Macadamia integrifolia]